MKPILSTVLIISAGIAVASAQPLTFKVPETYQPGEIKIITPHPETGQDTPHVEAQDTLPHAQTKPLSPDDFIEVALIRQLANGERLITEFFSTGPTDEHKTRAYLRKVLKHELLNRKNTESQSRS